MGKKNKNNKGGGKKAVENSISDILNLPESELGSAEGSMSTQDELDASVIDAVMETVNPVKHAMLLGLPIRKLRLADLAILLKADSMFLSARKDNEDKSVNVTEIGKVVMLLDYNLSYGEAFALASLDEDELLAKSLEFTAKFSFSSVASYITEVNDFLANSYANQPVVINDKDTNVEDKTSRILVGDAKGEGKD